MRCVSPQTSRQNTDVKRVVIRAGRTIKGIHLCRAGSARHYDAAHHALDFDGLLASLNEAQAGDVVLLFRGCHNPTGIDPTLDQWQQPAALSVEKAGCSISPTRLRPPGRGPEEDAEGLRAFAAQRAAGRHLLLENFWPVQRARRRLHLVAADQETGQTAPSAGCSR